MRDMDKSELRKLLHEKNVQGLMKMFMKCNPWHTCGDCNESDDSKGSCCSNSNRYHKSCGSKGSYDKKHHKPCGSKGSYDEKNKYK